MDRLEYAKQAVAKKGQVYIGENCEIDDTAIIGGDGFGWVKDGDTLFKMPHSGDVHIGDNVQVRAFCTIDRAVNGVTLIGKGTKLDHGCHIAHNVVIGEWNTFAAHCVVEGSCKIGHNNTFGTNVVVQKKITVGNNCIFGSGAVVTKDVLDNSVMVGNPARCMIDSSFD
jgi:UDP-3-O-[3-hydroxymyristoyl] glucosamine N-acyltransferase